MYCFVQLHNAIHARHFRLLISDMPQPQLLERSDILRSSGLHGFIELRDVRSIDARVSLYSLYPKLTYVPQDNAEDRPLW